MSLLREVERFRAFVSLVGSVSTMLPTPEALSIACPIESTQRQGHPDALALRASLVAAGLRTGRFNTTSCRAEPRRHVHVAPTLQSSGAEARRRGPGCAGQYRFGEELHWVPSDRGAIYKTDPPLRLFVSANCF